jgi:hypothetical protein
MAIDYAAILEPMTIFLISVLVFLVVFIGILYAVQKSFKRKVEVKKVIQESELILKNRTQALKKSENPETSLFELNLLARKFFYETFRLRKGLDYSELSTFFKERGKKSLSSFCDKMTDNLYSGKSVSSKQVKKLTILLEDSIDEQIKPQIIPQKYRPNTEPKPEPEQEKRIMKTIRIPGPKIRKRKSKHKKTKSHKAKKLKLKPKKPMLRIIKVLRPSKTLKEPHIVPPTHESIEIPTPKPTPEHEPEFKNIEIPEQTPEPELKAIKEIPKSKIKILRVLKPERFRPKLKRIQQNPITKNLSTPEPPEEDELPKLPPAKFSKIITTSPTIHPLTDLSIKTPFDKKSKEPKSHQNIENLDDLERIKKKIQIASRIREYSLPSEN